MRIGGRRAVQAGSLLVRASVVGVLVWLAARGFGAGPCPEHDVVAAASSCVELVSSLAARMGATAGAAVVLMELLSAGLVRTAVALEEDRRVAAEEAADPSSGSTR